MTKRLMITWPVLLTVLLSGCLEFERQEMVFRHDAASDSLYIFQDYRGIFGADDPARLTEAETEQMASVMKSERTFFFGNWVAEFSRPGFAEKLQAPKGELDADPVFEGALRALMGACLTNIQVENVGFYLNGKGQLCGAQRVTIRHISKVLSALNGCLRLHLRREANKWGMLKEARRALYAFVDAGEEVLRLEGNRVEIHWPTTEEDYQQFKAETPQARAFLESGGALQFSNGMAIATLGQRDGRVVVVSLPFSQKRYATNGLGEAKKYGIKESFDPAAAAKAFLNEAAARPARP
jgi:hypothetical protein